MKEKVITCPSIGVRKSSYPFHWYAGPKQQIRQLDFPGLSSEYWLAAGSPIIFTIATIVLLALAVADRSRQLHRTAIPGTSGK